MNDVAHYTAGTKLSLAALLLVAGQALAQSDPLPSWNEGACLYTKT